MTAAQGSYPHPVLGNGDDVSSSVELLNVVVAPTLDDVEVMYELRSTDPDLWRLIEGGVARHSLRWTCSATITTGEVKPELHGRAPGGQTLRTSIVQQLIRDLVTAEVRVIAAVPIKGHRWVNQHGDYGDATFDIEAGDVIAVAGAFTFSPEKFFDPLRPPIGSCFEFIEKRSARRGLVTDFSKDDVVSVHIPTDAYRALNQLVAQPALQIGVVVLPALMSAIQFIKEAAAYENGEDLEGRQWYGAIMGAVERNGSLEDSTFELAQRILSNPIDRALAAAIDTELQED